MEEEIDIFSSKIDLVRNALKSHYLNILKSGEISKNGIAWIIHNLWKIKMVIFSSMLPDFLDKDGKKYIFKNANLDFQNLQLKSRISFLKSWIKQQLILKN